MDYSDKTAAVAVTLAGAANATVTVNGVAEDMVCNIENVQVGSGNDTLIGGLGRDNLTGGAGAEIFKFGTGDSTVASIDEVADFSTGVDKMDLSIFSGAPSASAYAVITAASEGFAALMGAAQAQMTGKLQAVFVAATTNGWLFWNTDADPNTVEGAVMLTGKNSVSNFGFGDLKAAMACGNGGQRHARQSRPGGPARTCLETEVPGTPEDFRCANVFQSNAMADLLAIGRDTLELQQRYLCFEPRIGS